MVAMPNLIFPGFSPPPGPGAGVYGPDAAGTGNLGKNIAFGDSSPMAAPGNPSNMNTLGPPPSATPTPANFSAGRDQYNALRKRNGQPGLPGAMDYSGFGAGIL